MRACVLVMQLYERLCHRQQNMKRSLVQQLLCDTFLSAADSMCKQRQFWQTTWAF